MIDDEDESMKILGISGSNRKDGNSYLLLKEALQEVSPIERKIIQVAELQIGPCKLCFESCSLKPYECSIEDDFGIVLEEMKSADEIVIACPFYFYIPSRFQAFLERLSCVDYFTEERHGKGLSPLAKKPCALIVVSASGSGFNAFQILHHLQEFALTLGMLPVTTNKWPYIGLSAKSDDMERGAILKQTETISESKQFVRLLINEIEKRASK